MITNVKIQIYFTNILITTLLIYYKQVHFQDLQDSHNEINNNI